MPSHEAERAARIELGGIEQVKEQVREERLGNWLIRFSPMPLRSTPTSQELRRHRVMIFTLALAIGATTAIFSVVYGVLLRPLPYTDSSRIMALFESTQRAAGHI